jgi:type IV secretory pathway protease TraF
MTAPVQLLQQGARASRQPPHDGTIDAALELTHVDMLWISQRVENRVRFGEPILALDGQTVCRGGPRITVDGREMDIAHDKDHSGRPLPFWQGCRVIAEPLWTSAQDRSCGLSAHACRPVCLPCLPLLR